MIICQLAVLIFSAASLFILVVAVSDAVLLVVKKDYKSACFSGLAFLLVIVVFFVLKGAGAFSLIL